MPRDFWLSLIVTGLLLGLGHYFAWPRALGRLWSYVFGVGSILVGQLLWFGWGPVFWQSAAFAFVAGLAVGLSYLWDHIRNLATRIAVHERERKKDHNH